MKNIKSGVGFQRFVVGGGGGQAVQFFQGGEFFRGEPFDSFIYQFTQDVGADGVQGFQKLFSLLSVSIFPVVSERSQKSATFCHSHACILPCREWLCNARK